MLGADEERANRLLLERRLNDSQLLSRRITHAVQSAVLAHKAAGKPVSTWKDGKVIWIAPENIHFPEYDESDVASD